MSQLQHHSKDSSLLKPSGVLNYTIFVLLHMWISLFHNCRFLLDLVITFLLSVEKLICAFFSINNICSCNDAVQFLFLICSFHSIFPLNNNLLTLFWTGFFTIDLWLSFTIACFSWSFWLPVISYYVCIFRSILWSIFFFFKPDLLANCSYKGLDELNLESLNCFLSVTSMLFFNV